MSYRNQQQTTWNRSTILALAVAGVLGLSQASALAQQRVDRSGANDANTRVGSNGRNDNLPPRPSPWEVNNAIVYGNVTGGKQFRGNISSRDAREFRGNTANRQMDNFVRDSAGVTTGGIETFNANRTRAFFGDGRGVAPPPGFVGVNSLGAYTPPRVTPWRTVDPRQQAVSAGTFNTVVRPDQFGAPGAVDLQYAPGATVISPFAQQQLINPALLSDYTQLNRTGASALEPGDLAQLRSQTQNNATDPTRRAGNGEDAAQQQQQQAPNAVNDVVRPTNPVEGGGIDDTVRPGGVNNTLTPGIAPTEPGMRRTLAGAPAPEQGSTYRDLADRRNQQEQAKRPGQANEEAARAYNEQLRLREKDKADAANTDQPKPGTTDKPNAEGGGQQPDQMGQPGAGAAKPERGNRATPGGGGGEKNNAAGGASGGPLKVGSFAGSGGAKGTNDLLTKAEQQMRDGKYASAIESYDAAETLTPGNPLVRLGRAHAELGGAYYRRAETSLRRTLEGDKNLLAGQYDLKAFLGQERLQTVEQDLADLMAKNPNDVGAAVLLAYVQYNTGNERTAAATLDLADKRAKGEDKFVKLLKENWNLPKDGGAPADNK